MDLLAIAIIVAAIITLQFAWYVFNKEEYNWRNLLFLALFLYSVIGIAVLGLTVGGWAPEKQGLQPFPSYPNPAAVNPTFPNHAP